VTADRGRMRRIEFVLSAPVEGEHVETIGASTLVLGPGARAAWVFAET
jgi:hypothetical protein